MKALRYLLIAMVVVLASVTAQAEFKQVDTEYLFQSTSVMQGSGSSLPNSAVTGASTAGDCPAAYAPGRSLRRDVGGGGTTEDDPDPEDPEEPFPLGDGMWVMLLLAFGYCAYVTRNRVRAVRKRDDA